ncbi:MAG: hypothetical protein JWM59_2499 [Verrucomicrobiales bacterium]|nr:hypothetical protein [Verrucomicrobiales bacterium]
MNPVRLIIAASALAAPLSAGTVAVNLGAGWLFDAGGTGASNRLPVDTLCVLVADPAEDGFDPPVSDWVADDDVLVVVSDSEFPASSGGTRGFDLASGVTEPGLLSRSLIIDPAQFSGRTAPVPVALRWFPGYKAGAVDVTATGPAAGSAYGEFTRSVPVNPGAGTVGWLIPMDGGQTITLDPLAMPDFSGVDPPELGRASRLTGAPPAGTGPSGLSLALAAGGGVTLTFTGAPGLKYKVQRGTDLVSWPQEWTVTTGAAGAGAFTDATPPAGRAFYRVAGPISP